MSAVNSVLKEPQVFEAVWAHFKLDRAFPLPDFDESMLYGAVSEIIHNPSIREIIVSDASSGQYRGFFGELARYNKRSVVLFDEMLASTDESDDIVKS